MYFIIYTLHQTLLDLSHQGSSQRSDEELTQNLSREACSEKICLGPLHTISSLLVITQTYSFLALYVSSLIYVRSATENKTEDLFASETVVQYFVHKCLLQIPCAGQCL
jgi:hypothetical protein